TVPEPEKTEPAREKGFTPEASQQLAKAGLILHLPLGESKGNRVRSADGVPRGVVRGKATWVTDKGRRALDFDGKTHVEVPNGPDLQTDAQFSISLWVNAHSIKGWIALLGKMDQATGYRGYDVVLDDGKVVVHLIHSSPQDRI